LCGNLPGIPIVVFTIFLNEGLFCKGRSGRFMATFSALHTPE